MRVMMEKMVMRMLMMRRRMVVVMMMMVVEMEKVASCEGLSPPVTVQMAGDTEQQWSASGAIMCQVKNAMQWWCRPSPHYRCSHQHRLFCQHSVKVLMNQTG